jgi:beta-glucosidase
MKLKETGKPVVLVLINGRPVSINWADKNIPAIVEAWFPGVHGGTAIAEVLTGKYNPAGRMPVTTPRSVGQLLFNFPFKKGSQAGQPQAGPNGTGKTRVLDALYPFGYGLSYTTFKYSGLKITPEGGGTGSTVKISVNITNTGNYDGDEVVQLYINDEYSSVVTYEKVLRGFERVHLKKGETKTVTFTIQPDDLALYDRHMDFVVEPGKFNVYVGGSSEDVKAEGSFVLISEGENF